MVFRLLRVNISSSPFTVIKIKLARPVECKTTDDGWKQRDTVHVLPSITTPSIVRGDLWSELLKASLTPPVRTSSTPHPVSLTKYAYSNTATWQHTIYRIFRSLYVLQHGNIHGLHGADKYARKYHVCMLWQGASKFRAISGIQALPSTR